MIFRREWAPSKSDCSNLYHTCRSSLCYRKRRWLSLIREASRRRRRFLAFHASPFVRTPSVRSPSNMGPISWSDVTWISSANPLTAFWVARKSREECQCCGTVGRPRGSRRSCRVASSVLQCPNHPTWDSGEKFHVPLSRRHSEASNIFGEKRECRAHSFTKVDT